MIFFGCDQKLTLTDKQVLIGLFFKICPIGWFSLVAEKKEISRQKNSDQTVLKKSSNWMFFFESSQTQKQAGNKNMTNAIQWVLVDW